MEIFSDTESYAAATHVIKSVPSERARSKYDKADIFLVFKEIER